MLEILYNCLCYKFVCSDILRVKYTLLQATLDFELEQMSISIGIIIFMFAYS